VCERQTDRQGITRRKVGKVRVKIKEDIKYGKQKLASCTSIKESGQTYHVKVVRKH